MFGFVGGLGTLTMSPHLKQAGLDPAPGKDVTYVVIPTTEWLSALDRGRVDAVWMTDPYLSQVRKQLGATMLLDTMSGPTDGLPITGWAATEKGVHVRADMAARDDDLVGRGAAVGPDQVAVPALQRHPERRMMGRLRHASAHRLGEIQDPRTFQGLPQGHLGRLPLPAT
jgi:hypothetical protein